METQQREAPPLPDYFNAEDKGDVWHLHCKVCGKGWAAKKPLTGNGAHPGNVLHLLNHARGHKERRRRT